MGRRLVWVRSDGYQNSTYSRYHRRLGLGSLRLQRPSAIKNKERNNSLNKYINKKGRVGLQARQNGLLSLWVHAKDDRSHGSTAQIREGLSVCLINAASIQKVLKCKSYSSLNGSNKNTEFDLDDS